MKRCQSIGFLAVIFILCVPSIRFGQQSQGLFEQLNQINQAFKTAQHGNAVLEIAPKVWQLLDETLTTYLDQNSGKSVEQMNKDLYSLLQVDKAVDEFHWSAEIELYDSKVEGVFLAIYSDYYEITSLVSNLKVVQKSGDHWIIAGSMLDSSVISDLAPKRRMEAAKAAQRPSPSDCPTPARELVAEAFARNPLEFNGVSLLANTVQPLAGGGVQFVSRYDPKNVPISEPTLIEWEWTPNKRLEAVAWIWGDQWIDEGATWQTAVKSKKRTHVFLKDFYRP